MTEQALSEELRAALDALREEGVLCLGYGSCFRQPRYPGQENRHVCSRETAEQLVKLGLAKLELDHRGIVPS